MSRISRRELLTGSAVLGATAAGLGIAGEQQQTCELSALVEAHKEAYAAFMETMRKPHSTRNDHAARSRAEEKTLLAVCGFRAVSEVDRLAKATYLLKIEERGELDLREHIRAVLIAMM